MLRDEKIDLNASPKLPSCAGVEVRNGDQDPLFDQKSPDFIQLTTRLSVFAKSNGNR